MVLTVHGVRCGTYDEVSGVMQHGVNSQHVFTGESVNVMVNY